MYALVIYSGSAQFVYPSYFIIGFSSSSSNHNYQELWWVWILAQVPMWK